MVEARINEVLNGIQKIPLVIIPDEAVQPAQLLEINLKHREQAGNISRPPELLKLFKNSYTI